jgi:hypothetical protein
MKVFVGLIAVLALATRATAAAPQAKDPRVPSLQRNVNVLEGECPRCGSASSRCRER